MSAKRSLCLLAAGVLVCLLGFVTGLEGGMAPAAAEAEPAPIPAVQPQEVPSLPQSPQDVSSSAEAPQEVPDPPQSPAVDVDVVVFSTQTSGLAAVRELALGAPHLRVALISCGNLLETPLAQGLSVEDVRDVGRVKGGLYDEWRQAVIDAYARRGLKAFNASGRFVYEPQAAAQALWSYVQGPKAGNVVFYSARLLAASDEDDRRYADIQVEGGGSLRIRTRYFIDASVEGDLARMLGASYRIGRHEAVYNDVAGVKPPYPSAANGYETAPQRFSPLLTLKVYSKTNAPRIATFVHPNYNLSTYAGLAPLNQRNVSAFGTSWTMNIAVLPNGNRELNEAWNDWPDVGLAFQWIFSPEKRGEIRRRVLEWSINRVRYLQEHGYPKVGIAAVPQKLYVREGPRIVGLATYTAADLRAGTVRDSVALGCYVEYDRHDAFYPTHVEQTRYVHMPMEALMAQGHPRLLVSTAVSTDYAAYSSAVRMEHTRANMGGAAGAIIVLSDRLGVEPDQVPYAGVRSELLTRGYRLDVTG
ncbi:MAG: FAD-dependent oxidoreductase [bacterium]